MIPRPVTPAQPDDWRRAFRDAIDDPRELLSQLDLAQIAERLPPSPHPFPLRVPRGFVARMRRGDALDPLLRQVLPLDQEFRPQPGFVADPVGDGASRGALGVLHKYQGRALLLATGSCAIHCRYCFRRHYPYADDVAASANWAEAVGYLRAHPDVEELILSGGDPLSLSTSKLEALTEQLRDQRQLRRLRIHTRLPVVIPERVDAAFVAWLSGLPWRTTVVLHINHARELDDYVRAACERLRKTGAWLLNQSVLLSGVNDSVDALVALSQALSDAGVLPYYLHQLDRVTGAAHFEVEPTEARRLHDAARARLPGYLLPRLVREVEGEASKSPM